MKNVKKILILALILCALMCVNAFAAEITEITDKAAGVTKAEPKTIADKGAVAVEFSYSGVTQGNMYLVLILEAEADGSAPLRPTSSNILYVNQGTASDNTISFDNLYPSEVKESYIFLAGADVALSGNPLAKIALEVPHSHDWSTEWTKDTENHWKTCSGCAEVIEKAAHAWNEGVITTPATETTTGVKTFTCTACGQTKTETIPVLEHNHVWSTEWAKDADNHWKTCSGCAEVAEKAVHAWNAGTVTTPATGTTAGVKTFSCTVCGQTKTEEIPPLGGVLSGDADGNGVINNIDAMLVLQAYAGLPGVSVGAAADVDGNGIVNNIDAMLILQFYAGLITAFPAA